MTVPPLKITFSEKDIDNITSDIRTVLKSGQLSLGKMTKRFEERFAREINKKFAIAVNSGTTALEIFLRIRDIKGKTVIVPTNTNYATAAAVVFAGGTVKLIDGELFPSLESIKKSVDINTAGIIFVHIGGYLSPQLEKIKHFCDQKGLFLLEDAAHAHGASLNGHPAGSFGHAAAFSFFPTKIMTSGEGGILIVNNEEDCQQALSYRDQGKDPVCKKNIVWGNSWRMSEAQAVIGFHQLTHLKEFVTERNKIMKKYDSELRKFKAVKTYSFTEDMIPSGYKYIIRFSSSSIRNQVKKELEEKYHIFLGGGVYDIPIHQQPIFQGKFEGKHFSEAGDFCSQHLCLPIWSTMAQHEVEYVINSIRSVLIKM